MKRSRVILLFVLASALLAFVPKAEDPIERFVSALQRWSDVNPQEKVYLHLDKPYYAVGDTVWFKAYVTVGSRHQLSKLSGALYVELIDEKDSLLSSVKLPVTAGMAMGDFTLGDEYQAGNFRIRAYTQWMRNAGPEYFFDHTFAVGDALSSGASGNIAERDRSGADDKAARRGRKVDKADLPADSLSKSDVQFFSEGGNLLNGINSRIGFKATGVNGRGVAVKGVVTDNTGLEIIKFESLHAGMGVFALKPQAGKSYSARLTFADGSSKIVALPRAADQGYVLGVYQPNRDSVLVRIKTSVRQFQTPQLVNLIAQSGGETVFASQIKIANEITSIWLLKRDFPTGIVQFTLFDGRGEPINERIAFIKSNDGMELHVSSAKQVYKSREKVTINVESGNRFGDAVAGNFSVSVIDESKVPFDEADEHTILSSLLLSSDIRGYIEQPGYYFTNDTYKVNKALDNLMLTQGYRRFAWKEILGITSANKPLYNAESLGTEISGRVLSLSGKPVVNGEITLMSLSPGFMEKARTDADGRFAYQPIVLADSLKFAVQGRTAKKSKKVEVILDQVSDQIMSINKNRPDFSNSIAEDTKVYLENSKKQDEVLMKTGKQGRVNRLKQVNITAKKAQKLTYAAQGGLRIPEGHADLTYIMKDGDKCATLGVCLQGMLGQVSFKPFKDPISGITVQSYPYSQGLPMIVIVDGMRITEAIEIAEIFDQNVLDPEQIVKIDVVRTNEALKSILGGQSILIYTKRRRKQKPRYTPDIVNIKPKGFNKAREFYSPRYDRPAIGNQLPDLRSTIYWNPKLKTYASGSTSFSFFNADGPGTYRVTIEGINAAGELARQVYRYEVQAGPSVQTEMGPGNTVEVVTAMKALQQRIPAEKLYVHTDKPYYNLGDTIWFKAYLFDAATLAASKRSGLLYVELNDDTAEVVRRISIPVKDGIGYAQIPLVQKIFHEGGYTMRAYTNWMQNFGSDYFFTKRLYLGIPTKDTWVVRSSSAIRSAADKSELQADLILNRSDQSAVGLRDVEVKIMEGDRQLYKENMQTGTDGRLLVKHKIEEKTDGRNVRIEILSLSKNDGNQRLLIPLNIKRYEKTDLQFLPEGGNLVTGLKSRIGFKAIGEDGRGTYVSGTIYDTNENPVTAFSSLYNGMGSFEFTPKTGETYFAKLTQPDSLDKVFDLPMARPEGIVLHVNNKEENDSLELSISSSPAAIAADSIYNLIGTSSGIVIFAQTLDPEKPKLKIPKNKFPSGITRFTLLRNKTPLNERLVFIDHGEDLRITVKTDKPDYYKKDSVNLVLEVRDKDGNPVKGNFSIAVTDNSQVKADTAGNYGIASTLLINAGLKGAVETPGYYLNRNNKQRWQALDNLMLTQGWIGYSWEDAFTAPKPAAFAAESHFRLTGTVANILKKPVAGAQMLISSQKPFFITTTITDDKGRYVFENLPQIDSGSFFIQARTPKDKSMNFGEVTVEKFSPPAVPEHFRDTILPWYVNTDVVQFNYVRYVKERVDERNLKKTGIALKEVKIIDKKIIKGSRNRNISKGADMVFDEKDIKESGVLDLYHLLKQKIPGIKVVMEDALPTLKLNDYMAVIEIDGGGLPVKLNGNPTVQELIEELGEFKIEDFLGLEVMYSRKYTRNYGRKSDNITYKGSDINASETALRSGSQYVLDPKTLLPLESQSGPIPLYENQPFYKMNYKQSAGYLELRANVLTNKPREFAVIGITTKSGRGWHRNNRPDFAVYRPLPLLHPQEFYSPKYTIKGKDNAEPDYRSTIYWKPNAVTDVNGKVVLSFYTSDIAGSYNINIQGSNMDGLVGSAGATIKVVNQNK